MTSINLPSKVVLDATIEKLGGLDKARSRDYSAMLLEYELNSLLTMSLISIIDGDGMMAISYSDLIKIGMYSHAQEPRADHGA